MKLYIDDIRIAPEGYTLARTISEAITFLEMYGDKITEISIDHDISIPVEVNGLQRPYPSNETFCAVARYMRVVYEYPEEIKVIIHTANPDGAKALASILKNFSPTYIPCKPCNRLEYDNS